MAHVSRCATPVRHTPSACKTSGSFPSHLRKAHGLQASNAVRQSRILPKIRPAPRKTVLRQIQMHLTTGAARRKTVPKNLHFA